MILINENSTMYPTERGYNNHVLIMLAQPDTSVKRFFERPDMEKQFIYQLLMEENNPGQAMDNFRQCLERINSPEQYNAFLNSGFNVILRNEKRSIDETLCMVEKAFGLSNVNIGL